MNLKINMEIYETIYADQQFLDYFYKINAEKKVIIVI